MTNQNTIPADKVRELKTKYEYDTSGDPERLLDHLLHDLDDLLPAPAQPTTGLLGRWAKHPQYGDVVCEWDNPNPDDGDIYVRWLDSDRLIGTNGCLVPLSSLTFPHQATRPEDVPAGEAWLVNLNGGKHTRVVALKVSHDTWRIGRSDSIVTLWRDEFVELIAPLVPERPVSDLQAKYDDLEKRWKHLDDLYSARGSFIDELRAKYREAQERIKALEQATPRIVTAEAEYAALPTGSIVGQPDQLDVCIKNYSRGWDRPNTTAWFTSRDLAGTTRTVVRYGWGDEPPKPAWRIEHDHRNLRVGEYIIDYVDDGGTVEYIDEAGTRYIDEAGTRRTYAGALGKTEFAPFIVFSNRDAATPEAVEEATEARDKEMGK